MTALTCQQLVELVTGHLEGTLGRRDRRRVARHLRGCADCDRYVAQMRQTLALLGTVPVATLSPRAQATLLAAFGDFRR